MVYTTNATIIETLANNKAEKLRCDDVFILDYFSWHHIQLKLYREFTYYYQKIGAVINYPALQQTDVIYLDDFAALDDSTFMAIVASMKAHKISMINVDSWSDRSLKMLSCFVEQHPEN